jgi:glycosyltransferase involved in cell wall biosynthesis
MCAALGIAGRAHFPGFISAAQGLPEIYRLASLFATASEIETQGIVLLEAAASGLPIAAVRATCIPEIVHHGVNGSLAEPGDAHGLARAMSAILGSPSRAAAMGRESLRLAREHDCRRTMDAHEQLYFTAEQIHGRTRQPVETAQAAQIP